MNATKSSIILIVEDDDELRKTVVADFQRKGFQVLSASGGHDAFQIIEHQKVDLVISDHFMPKGNGIELLERIKDRDISLPVFMLTGANDGDLSPDEIYELGAEAVFLKPFNRKELYDSVAYSLLPYDDRFQRQAPRMPIESAVGVKFLKSNFSSQEKTLNLGRGGMFVALQGQFPVNGEEVEFHLKAVTEPIFELTGRGVVRWVRREEAEDIPSGCGIEFTNLDPSSKARLVEITSQIKYRSFIPKK